MLEHHWTACTAIVAVLLVSACGGNSTVSPTLAQSQRPPSQVGDSASKGALGQVPEQETLVGRVPGRSGGYESAIRVVEAQRSVGYHHRAILLSLVGGDYVHQIGTLTVRCTRTPLTRFTFSAAARRFGGPALSRDSTRVATRAAVVRAVASLSNFTRRLDSSPAVGRADRAVIDHYAMSFGGEAVQYSANVTAISVPTEHGCATAADATVVEHFAGVIGAH